MNNILILANTNLLKDGRIRRHIFALKDEYKLLVTGIKNPNISGEIEFIDCSKEPITNLELDNRRKLLRKRIFNKEYEKVYWGETYIQKLYDKLTEKDIDIILANDISMVPLAVKLAREKSIKVIADMHEYAPKEFEDIESWKLLFEDYIYYLCNKYLPKCDEIITVATGIAKEYYKEFHINMHVLTNAPEYKELSIKPTDINSVKMVYHGAANSSRNLENLLEVMKNLDERFSLDLYLVEDYDGIYFKNLVEKINFAPRCNLKKSVVPERIVDMLHEYDIGIFLLKPVNLNYKYALPNKFFEFIQSRLAVAIGPSEEMKYYVDKFNCGVVSEDFNPKTLAKKLNSLTNNDIDTFKTNSEKIAKMENAEKNKEILLNLINSFK